MWNVSTSATTLRATTAILIVLTGLGPAGCGSSQPQVTRSQAAPPVSSSGARTTAPISTVTLPAGSAAKACLLTVAQAAELIGAPVHLIDPEPDSHWSRGHCTYGNVGASDQRSFAGDVNKYLAVLREITVYVGCSSEFSADFLLANPVPVPGSAPGAVRNGGLEVPILAPLQGPGNCWTGVALGGEDAWRGSQAAVASRAVALAYGDWKG